MTVRRLSLRIGVCRCCVWRHLALESMAHVHGRPPKRRDDSSVSSKCSGNVGADDACSAHDRAVLASEPESHCGELKFWNIAMVTDSDVLGKVVP